MLGTPDMQEFCYPAPAGSFHESDHGIWMDHDGLMPPPFGGPEPSYIANKYVDDMWYGRTINPTLGYQYGLNIGEIPAPFRWYAKWLIWSSEYIPRGPGSRVLRTMGSACALAYQVKHLVCFVHERGYARVQDVPPEILIAAAWDYSGVRKDGTRSAGPNAKASKKKKSKQSVRHYFAMLDRAFYYGPSGNWFIPDGPICDASDSAVELIKKAVGTTGTKEIPEDTAHRLLNEAILWVENHAEAILDLRNEVARMSSFAKQHVNLSNGDMWQRFVNRWNKENPETLKALVECLTVIRCDWASLCAVLRHKAAKERMERYLEDGDPHHLLTLIRLISDELCCCLTAACYVVTAGFSGFRMSEILGLKVGWIRKVGDRWLLNTEILKTTATGLPYQTERPVSAIVGTAYEVLLAHSKVHWPRNDKRLFLTPSGAVSERLKIISKLNVFARITGVPPFHFASHQFRRFFALFYVRRFKGNLDALRRHFRHVSRDMIMAYAGDAGNAKYLVEEERALAFEIAHTIVHGGSAYASRGVGQREIEMAARYKAQNLPPKEIERRLRKHIGKHYVQVWANEWGYCLVQRHDYEGSACGSSDGLPNHAKACPETCGICKYLAIGDENVGFWTHTILVHQKIVEHELTLPNAARTSRAMIRMVERLLDKMMHGELKTRRAVANGVANG